MLLGEMLDPGADRFGEMPPAGMTPQVVLASVSAVAERCEEPEIRALTCDVADAMRDSDCMKAAPLILNLYTATNGLPVERRACVEVSERELAKAFKLACAPNWTPEPAPDPSVHSQSPQEERCTTSKERTVVGIDLGTTYSLVAKMSHDGTPAVLPNALGELLTPSRVAVEEDGRALVGAPARARATTHPSRTALSFKRDMGTDRIITLGDRQFAPQQLSALVRPETRASAAPIYPSCSPRCSRRKSSASTDSILAKSRRLQGFKPRPAGERVVRHALHLRREWDPRGGHDGGLDRQEKKRWWRAID